MRTIHKFTLLHISWKGSLQIPKGAQFCGFDFQNERPTLWFEVDTAQFTETRNFEVVGTGANVPNGGQHLASVQVYDGRYWVWHLYEVVK